MATAAAIELYWNRPDFARAERLLAGLLKDKRLNPLPAVWRLAAVLAGQRGQHARQLEHLEQALLRTYTLGKAPIDLEQYRQDHRDLLSRYRRLATNVADLGPRTTGELAARLVRAADRWRELEDDPTEVCQLAAEVLSTLGHKELAWKYVTTPLALRPHEGGSWSAVAQQLQSQGELDLAERAYAAAFEAEGSNPQHLWERARLLQQQGRLAEARRLYQQIAEGQWPPQHQSLQRDARQIVGGTP